MKKIPQQDGLINNVDKDVVIAALKQLESNTLYETKPTYRGDALKWPGNEMSFIDFHLNYLKVHPTLDPYHYLSNLRLVLKKTPH